jgi:hypothetical protein
MCPFYTIKSTMSAQGQRTHFTQETKTIISEQQKNNKKG